MSKVTQEYLKSILDYDPKTGIWTWINPKPRSGIKPGTRAGCVSCDNGYRIIRLLGKNYYESRLAFMYMLGRWPEPEADHKNRIRDDNRWCNLKEVTKSQNQFNRSDQKTKRGFPRGVRPSKSKFIAVITVNKQYHYLGTYDTVTEASEAYQTAWKMYHV